MRKQHRIFFFLAFCFINCALANKSLDSLEQLIVSQKNDKEERFKTVLKLWEDTYYLIKTYQLSPFPKKYKVYLEQSISWAEKEGTPKQLAHAQINLLKFIYYSRNTKKTISKALELLLKIDSFSDEERFRIYDILSISYFKIGYYQKYIELIPKKYEALKNFDPDSYSISIKKKDLANVYHKIKQYENARRYYFEAIQTIPESKKALAQQSSLFNDIAITFDSEHKYDSAFRYYNKALEVAKVAHFRLAYPKYSALYKEHFINVIESAIANLDQSPSNYNFLIGCLIKEANSAVLVGEANIYLSAWSKLGELYYKKKEYVTALLYSAKSDSVFRTDNSDFELYIKNIRLKAKIAIATNQATLGNQLFDRIKFLNDSIATRKSNDLTEVAAIVYQTAEKEKEIQQQQLTLIKNNKMILQERNKQVIFIISICLLLITLFFFYRFTQKLKKQKALIENQKLLLNNSLKQKDILLKEVHHRVKNNLQVISSILHKQARMSSDHSVKDMMEEGQNRIKSMALIHQKLYQTKDFRNIDMKSYIKELTKIILASNQQTDINIELELNLSETNFHIDVAIPLGLILNELLTNAYKYAFIGRAKGKISVSIKKKEAHRFEMRVADNGVGLPENMKEKIKESLGISLVKGLAWQLRGRLEYQTEQGSVFTVLFTNQLSVI